MHKHTNTHTPTPTPTPTPPGAGHGVWETQPFWCGFTDTSSPPNPNRKCCSSNSKQTWVAASLPCELPLEPVLRTSSL